jgi:tRNA (guanine-N7-)-methyltransferase
MAAMQPDVSAPVFEGPVSPDEVRPDWTAIFGVECPLHLEIGSGRGHFALDYAATHDVNFIAIEMRRSDCDDIRRRRDKRGLRNLEVFQGDARLLLPRFFTDGQLEAIHIHCPDPWWKKRHHRRRLIADDFGLQLWSLLKVGGELDLRTDVPAYSTAMVETCEQIIGFQNAHGPGQERPREGLILSTRERRYAITGQPVFRYEYRRPAGEPLTETAEKAWLRREWSDVRRK